MADALNTRAIVSKAIIERNANYLLCLKTNSGNKELKQHFEAIFNRQDALKEKSSMVSLEHVQKEHGRINESYISVLPASLIDSRIKNPHTGVSSIVRFTKVSTKLNGNKQKTTTNTRYYICSLDFNKAHCLQIQKSIFEYWAIETHHGILDNPKVFNQDDLQSHRQDFISNNVGLNKICLNILSYIRADLNSKRKGARTITYAMTQAKMTQSTLLTPLKYLCSFYLDQ